MRGKAQGNRYVVRDVLQMTGMKNKTVLP